MDIQWTVRAQNFREAMLSGHPGLKLHMQQSLFGCLPLIPFVGPQRWRYGSSERDCAINCTTRQMDTDFYKTPQWEESLQSEGTEIINWSFCCASGDGFKPDYRRSPWSCCTEDWWTAWNLWRWDKYRRRNEGRVQDHIVEGHFDVKFSLDTFNNHCLGKRMTFGARLQTYASCVRLLHCYHGKLW